MQIFVAQVSPKIGNLKYNFELIKKYYISAVNASADICLLPECVTTGYLPKDLLFKYSFIKNLQQEIDQLINEIKQTALILPTPIFEHNKLFNGVLVIQNGRIIGNSTKKHLPSYGVFDEQRYFVEGHPQVINVNGTNIAIAICEDIWHKDFSEYFTSNKARMLLVPNASPYSQGKFQERLNIAKQRFDEINIPIIYCNQVLGHDGIVFDGRSFGYTGQVAFVLNSFSEDSKLLQITNGKVTNHSDVNPDLELEDELYGAMVLSLRDYITNNGFTAVLLGLSGGIDSALVATIAVDSLGAKNVSAIMMPSIFNSADSKKDAQILASNLAIDYQVIPITNILDKMSAVIPQITPLAYENLQSRIRGTILMSIANSKNMLLLSTGNKSEIATGYTTLYGDMCGAFNPIKDLYKTQLLRVAKFRNKFLPKSIEVFNKNIGMICQNIMTKPPSAELAFGQKDSDLLPPYELLDNILHCYIEQNLGKAEIVSIGFDAPLVDKVLKLIKLSEFKRKQSAPGTKLSICDFNTERRYPITNGYEQ